MSLFADFIIEILTGISPVLQMVGISFFSYAEGLPVIGSILPGGTVALLAGSLSTTGIFSPYLAFVVIAVSSFLGDMTGFLLGKKFKKAAWIKKIVNNEKHQKSWDLFDRHVAMISIFGKLIPVVRSTPSIFAAVRGIKTRRYMIYSFLGSFLWAFVGVFLGKVLTEFLGKNAVLLIFGLLIVPVIFILVRQIIKSKKIKTL